MAHVKMYEDPTSECATGRYEGLGWAGEAPTADRQRMLQLVISNTQDGKRTKIPNGGPIKDKGFDIVYAVKEVALVALLTSGGS